MPSLGRALDGGWWALGPRRGWEDEIFRGVEMSTDHTGEDQLSRLRALGHQVRALPTLRAVDDIRDAEKVAERIPGSRFAAALARTAWAQR